MDLDEPRREIVEEPGHVLVTGGPGCGKTTIALIKAVARMAQLEPEQRVLFLSFSRAAVRQIADRAAGVVPHNARRQLEVRTFHSFFIEMISAHGRLINGQECSFIPPTQAAVLRADFEGDWETETIRLAEEESRFVFDRLADAAATLLTKDGAVRSLYSDTYPLVIVDEFQDTNESQWSVVRALAQASQVVLLADPDQRIYDFIEGVTDQRIPEACAELKPRDFDLSKDNHRSPTGGILDFANAVLRNDGPLPKVERVGQISYTYYSEYSAAIHKAVKLALQFADSAVERDANVAVLGTDRYAVSAISEILSEALTADGEQYPAVEHYLHWDAGLAAMAGEVIASILEWPGLPEDDRVDYTLSKVSDFYRVKFISSDPPVKSARSTSLTLDRARAALAAGKAPKAKAAKDLLSWAPHDINLSGEPIRDWRTVRSTLGSGSRELLEIVQHARMLRLFKASDSLAWGLMESWDGTSYVGGAMVVRSVLEADMIDSLDLAVPRVSLMNMHKSKGKEFDAVIIGEGVYLGKLLDPERDAKWVGERRRLLRVAITRARHLVVFVRPRRAHPLVDHSH